ncbi:hypothetical protein LX36DRAFT_391740 [Colletotrichum falcatum]|nr:hypothetical protein LX36DRAFT_391740 [Colletotrichum falcatum]
MKSPPPPFSFLDRWRPRMPAQARSCRTTRQVPGRALLMFLGVYAGRCASCLVLGRPTNGGHAQQLRLAGPLALWGSRTALEEPGVLKRLFCTVSLFSRMIALVAGWSWNLQPFMCRLSFLLSCSCRNSEKTDVHMAV